MEDPKTTVRRNYPLAVAIPSDVSKSMPPRVRSWRVAARLDDVLAVVRGVAWWGLEDDSW